MAGRVGRNDKGGDSLRVTRLAGSAREDEIGVGAGNLAVPSLAAVDHPHVAIAHACRLEPRSVAAVAGFREAERQMLRSGDDALDIGLLLCGSVVGQRRDDREIADDRGFILQIVVQAEALRRQMFADGGDCQIGGGRAAAGFRQAVAKMTCLVGPALHFRDQRPPFSARAAVLIPVGPRMFAPVVEKLHVHAFERPDLRLDERVQIGQLVRDLPGQIEIQGLASHLFGCSRR